MHQVHVVIIADVFWECQKDEGSLFQENSLEELQKMFEERMHEMQSAEQRLKEKDDTIRHLQQIIDQSSNKGRNLSHTTPHSDLLLHPPPTNTTDLHCSINNTAASAAAAEFEDNEGGSDIVARPFSALTNLFDVSEDSVLPCTTSPSYASSSIINSSLYASHQNLELNEETRKLKTSYFKQTKSSLLRLAAKFSPACEKRDKKRMSQQGKNLKRKSYGTHKLNWDGRLRKKPKHPIALLETESKQTKAKASKPFAGILHRKKTGIRSLKL